MTAKTKSLEKTSKPEVLLSHERAPTRHGDISAPNVDALPGPYAEAGNLAIQRLLDHGAIQTKLTIVQPNDKYEQEADQVADQVMGMPEPQVQRQPLEEEEDLIQTKRLPLQITPLVQRQVANEEEEEPNQTKGLSEQRPEVIPNLEARIDTLKGGGQPLPQSARSFFEPRFGRNLSHVQVHADAKADTLNLALSARAFTTGKDMFFQQGAFSPDSSSGRELLAHELTHVVQQTERVRPKLGVVQAWNKYEQQADQSAIAVRNKQQQTPFQNKARQEIHREIEEEVQTKRAERPLPLK